MLPVIHRIAPKAFVVGSALLLLSAAAAAAPGKGRHHLVCGLEHAVGIVQGDPPRLGQLQPPAAPLKQLMTNAFFQQPDLCGQRRLRHVKPPRGVGEIAVMRHRMKIAQMLEIEVHGPRLPKAVHF